MHGRVLVVSCGGTISSVRGGTGGVGDAGGAAPRLPADDLVAVLPELAALAEVETHTFSIVPSSDLTLDDAVELHRLVTRRVDTGPELAGVVVTQGTDTLEEVAFALDLLWDRPCPLVVTGAMRNPSLPGSDGPANLLAAVATATSATARGLGVLVVANDEIHAAAHVRKRHTHNVATFGSPTVGPLGYVVERRARVLLTPRRHPPLGAVTGVVNASVALLGIGLGEDDRLLGAILPAGYRGLVVEGLGGGHLPRVVAESPALRDLVAAIPVVLASRVGSGELLRATYAFPGSEVDLAARGLLSAGVLDGRKARVLLSLLLAEGAGRDSIEGTFARFHGDAPFP